MSITAEVRNLLRIVLKAVGFQTVKRLAIFQKVIKLFAIQRMVGDFVESDRIKEFMKRKARLVTMVNSEFANMAAVGLKQRVQKLWLLKASLFLERVICFVMTMRRM